MGWYDDYDAVEASIAQGGTYDDIKEAIADLDSRNPDDD